MLSLPVIYSKAHGYESNNALLNLVSQVHHGDLQWMSDSEAIEQYFCYSRITKEKLSDDSQSKKRHNILHLLS